MHSRSRPRGPAVAHRGCARHARVGAVTGNAPVAQLLRVALAIALLAARVYVPLKEVRASTLLLKGNAPVRRTIGARTLSSSPTTKTTGNRRAPDVASQGLYFSDIYA